MADMLSAVNAYRNQMNMMRDSDAPTDALGSSNGTSFSQMVEQAVGDASKTLQNSEALQMQSLTGKVELSDLVTAVANAELTLNTVVAVRDRVISAYQDIIRMSI